MWWCAGDDLRGAAGRTRAVASAVRAGLARGEHDQRIAARLTAVGFPLALW
jgi:hypothetical protein